MRSVDVLEVLELVGSTQWGLVTTSQALEAGVSKMQLSRLTDRGTLVRVRHGVYALPSADSGPHQGLRAAWLAAGGDSDVVVTGQSAAAVHGLGNLVPARYEFTAPTRKQTTQPDVRYRKATLLPEDVTSLDGLPVASVPRTVADLASNATDFDHLADVVKDALEASGTTASALAFALDPSAHRYGESHGRELLSSLLDAAGYRPDPGMLDLYGEQVRQAALQSLTPQLQQAVSAMVKAQVKGPSESAKSKAFGSVSEKVLAQYADATPKTLRGRTSGRLLRR